MRCEHEASENRISSKSDRRRRAVWVCGVVLFSVLVLDMTAGCGRKKPPRPLQQDTAQLFHLESMSAWLPLSSVGSVAERNA